MRSITSLAAILASEILVSALPNPLPNSNSQGISLEMVKRAASDSAEGFVKRAGPQGSVTVVSLEPAQEKWTINMQVGGQTLPIVVDTGSHDFWIESNQQPPSSTGSNHPLYTPPTTASPIPGATWAAKFDGDTSPVAAGVAYYDTVVIGGATVTSQVVGAVTSIASVNNQKKSGIIGLSHAVNQINYGSYSPAPKAVLKNFYDQLHVNNFTLDLRTDNTGTLDLGYVNPSKYTSAITYVNRDSSKSPSNWYIPVDAYFINGVQQTDKASGNGVIHPDSGAPFIYLPTAAVKNYYSQVSGSFLSTSDNQYKFPCSVVQNNQMPSLGLSFGGVKFDVPGSWMWIGQSGSTCTGALQLGSDTSFAIAGDMFLRTVFAVYDMTGNNAQGRVGFATKNLPARAMPN